MRVLRHQSIEPTAEKKAVDYADQSIDRPTDDERLREFLLRMRLRGLSVREAAKAAATPEDRGGVGLRVSPLRAASLMQEALQNLTGDEQTIRPFRRTEQEQRLRGYIRRLQEPRFRASDKARQNPIPVPYGQILRAEELLADLQGNREPIRIEVDVQVKTSLAAVVARLTPERMQELKDRARERALSATAPPMLGVGTFNPMTHLETGTRVPVTIDVPAEPVPALPAIPQPPDAAPTRSAKASAPLAPPQPPSAPRDPKEAALARHRQFMAEQEQNRKRARA